MITTHTLESLQDRKKPIVLAAGFFDGVHMGHQSVLQEARQQADAVEGEAWVLTFETHPLKVLRPEVAPRMLTSPTHKTALLRQAGMHGVLLLPFTKALASTSAEAFCQWLFHCAPSLRSVVIGDNWRFGSKAKGTPAFLAAQGEERGIEVTVMPPIRHGDQPVSSTRIRQAVVEGNLVEAETMLGRPYSVLGTVVHGQKIGRVLGYPSANLDPHNEVLPPLGIYAVQARIGNTFHDGALSYGTRPTFDKNDDVSAVVELHLLDFSGDLYDQDVEAYFIRHLRDEWRFATVEELQTQISEDIRQTRAVLETNGLTDTHRQTLCQGWGSPS